MLHYAVSGRGATPTTSFQYGALWNPSTTQRVYVVRASIWCAASAVARPRISHITARGTPGSTVTPDADNALDSSGIAPPSGLLLDLPSYTVSATITTPAKDQIGNANNPGSGIELIFSWPGIAVAPGTGLAFDIVANLATTDVTFEWLE